MLIFQGPRGPKGVPVSICFNMYYYTVIISQEFSHGSGMEHFGWALSFCSNLIFQGEPGPKGEKVKIAANFIIICEMPLEDYV